MFTFQFSRLGHSPNCNLYIHNSCIIHTPTATGDQYDESDEDDDDLDSIDLEECYVVTRDYTKLSLDELDVYEGQMVCIIDDSDRGNFSNHDQIKREEGEGGERERETDSIRQYLIIS